MSDTYDIKVSTNPDITLDEYKSELRNLFNKDSKTININSISKVLTPYLKDVNNINKLEFENIISYAQPILESIHLEDLLSENETSIKEPSFISKNINKSGINIKVELNNPSFNKGNINKLDILKDIKISLESLRSKNIDKLSLVEKKQIYKSLVNVVSNIQSLIYQNTVKNPELLNKSIRSLFKVVLYKIKNSNYFGLSNVHNLNYIKKYKITHPQFINKRIDDLDIIKKIHINKPYDIYVNVNSLFYIRKALDSKQYYNFLKEMPYTPMYKLNEHVLNWKSLSEDKFYKTINTHPNTINDSLKDSSINANKYYDDTKNTQNIWWCRMFNL